MPSLRAWWHRLYRRLQDWITPGLQHAQYVYIDTLRRLAPSGPLWLDAGCGRGLLPEWVRSMETSILKPGHRIVGIDVDFSSLLDNRTVTWRIAGNLGEAPFRPASFAFISANMIMEHVDTPMEALHQVADLLPPGGIFVFHTPNYWNYQIFFASCLPQHWKNRLVGWLGSAMMEQDVRNCGIRAVRRRRRQRSCAGHVRCHQASWTGRRRISY